MAQFIKLSLSGSTNGRLIKISETSSPGNTIHTAVSQTTSYDEIWLWAMNSGTSDVVLYIEWGGTSNPDDRIILTVPWRAGLILVVPGLILNGGVVARAFASESNVITVGGYVNRISP